MDLYSAQDALDNRTVDTGSSSENINMARLLDQAEKNISICTSPRRTDRRRTLAPLDYKFNSIQLEDSSASSHLSMCSTGATSSSKSFLSVEKTLKLSKSTKKSWKPKGGNVQRMKPTVLDGHDGVLLEAAQSSDRCSTPDREKIRLYRDKTTQDENDNESLLKTNEKEETLPQSTLSDLTWQSNSPAPIIELPPEPEPEPDETFVSRGGEILCRSDPSACAVVETGSLENNLIETDTVLQAQRDFNFTMEKNNDECSTEKKSKVLEKNVDKVSGGGSISENSMNKSKCRSNSQHSSHISSRPVRRSRHKLPRKYEDYEVPQEIQKKDSETRLTPLPEKETIKENEILDEESRDLVGRSKSINLETPMVCVVDPDNSKDKRRSEGRSFALELLDYTESTIKTKRKRRISITPKTSKKVKSTILDNVDNFPPSAQSAKKEPAESEIIETPNKFVMKSELKVPPSSQSVRRSRRKSIGLTTMETPVKVIKNDYSTVPSNSQSLRRSRRRSIALTTMEKPVEDINTIY